MRTTVISLVMLAWGGLAGHTQEVWSLEQCIEQAWQRNLQVKQSELGMEAAESQLRNTRGNMLPNLNGFASHNYNWGQRIDPFTNQFATTRVLSNSFGLSSDVMLFNGFQNQQALKAQQAALEASQYDLQAQKNTIALNVSSAYLMVLLTEELIEVAERQVAISQNQLQRMEKLVQAGSRNVGAQYELEAQLARDRAALVQRRNDYRLAQLQLKQLMLVPADQPLSIEKPGSIRADASATLENANTVYGMAENSMPEVKGAQYSLLSQERRLKQAQSGWYPTLSLSGSIGTGYSGLRTEVESVSVTGTEEIGFTVAGDPVYAPTFETSLRQVSFFNQLSDNFNQFVGLSLSVPIFNRWNVSSSVQQARINWSIAQLQYEQVKRDLRQRIEQARLDAETARETYVANESSVRSSEKAFEFAQARFEAGAMNVTEFNNAKTNLQIAQSQLLQAKYDFVFKTRVLDFYMGKPLKL